MFPCLYFQLLVQAYDLGTPQRNATNTVPVRVTVVRNNFAPVFNFGTYRRTILENHAVDTSVIQVTASDSDFNNVRTDTIFDFAHEMQLAFDHTKSLGPFLQVQITRSAKHAQAPDRSDFDIVKSMNLISDSIGFVIVTPYLRSKLFDKQIVYQ